MKSEAGFPGPEGQVSKGIPAVEGESTLARLLAAEGQLDRELADAARAAAAALREADANAEARRKRADDRIETAVIALRRQVELERRERQAQLEASTKRKVEALGRLDEARIETLARQVVDRVLGSIGSPGGAS